MTCPLQMQCKIFRSIPEEKCILRQWQTSSVISYSFLKCCPSTSYSLHFIYLDIILVMCCICLRHVWCKKSCWLSGIFPVAAFSVFHTASFDNSLMVSELVFMSLSYSRKIILYNMTGHYPALAFLPFFLPSIMQYVFLCLDLWDKLQLSFSSL